MQEINRHMFKLMQLKPGLGAFLHHLALTSGAQWLGYSIQGA